jgi:hypothetical protein
MGVFGLEGEATTKMEALEAEISGTSPPGRGVNGEPAPLHPRRASHPNGRRSSSSSTLSRLVFARVVHRSCPSPTGSLSASSQMNETLSTDASYPRSNPLLSRFNRTFPCIFFLEDFLFSPSPNLSLRRSRIRSVLDLLSGRVCSSLCATRVVGRSKRTYTQFAEGKTLHGYMIFVRGGR